LNKELAQLKDNIEALTQQNSLLKNDNTKLNNHLLELKQMVSDLTQKNMLLKSNNAQINTDIEGFKGDIESLNIEHKVQKNSLELDKKSTIVDEPLSDLKPTNLAKSSLKDTATSISFIDNLNTNWIYVGIAILLGLVLIVFSIYNNNKRRHFDLNTIRRH